MTIRRPLVMIAGQTQQMPLGDLVDPATESAAAYANLLINGGFDLAQRQAPATFTTIATDKYGPDRWRISSQTASLQYKRVDTDGALEAGLASRYYGQFKQITGAGKFLVCQPLEGMVTAPLRGRNLALSVALKASAAKTVQVAILELTSAGTTDAIPATLVPTWNGNTVIPTFATNVTFTSGPVVLGTTWSTYTATNNVGATTKNLMLAIWTDSQFAANDTLSIGQAGLWDAATAAAWLPRPPAAELALAQRYFEKSYDVDTGAPTNTAIPGLTNFPSKTVMANADNLGGIVFKVAKRIIPVVTVYSYTASTTSKMSDAGGADLAAGSGTPDFLGRNGCCVRNSSGATLTPAGGGFICHWGADAEL